MGLESQGKCIKRNKAPKQKEKKGNDHLMTLLNSFRIFHCFSRTFTKRTSVNILE